MTTFAATIATTTKTFARGHEKTNVVLADRRRSDPAPAMDFIWEPGSANYSWAIGGDTYASTTPKIQIGDIVVFTAIVTWPENSPRTVASYKWDFGDGTTSTSATPQKTFKYVSNNQRVRLVVTDDLGREFSMGKQVYLEAFTGITVVTAVQGGVSGTTDVITKPSSVASGDLLLYFHYSQDARSVSAWPSGFTQVLTYSISNMRITVGRKIATGSEPSNYTFTLSGTNASGANSSLMVLRNVHATTPITATSTSTGAGSGGHTIANYPSVNCDANGRWLAWMTTTSGVFNIAPPGMVQWGAGMRTMGRPLAGPTPVKSFEVFGSGSVPIEESWIAVSLAVAHT